MIEKERKEECLAMYDEWLSSGMKQWKFMVKKGKRDENGYSNVHKMQIGRMLYNMKKYKEEKNGRLSEKND